jgi:hypothetical protein
MVSSERYVESNAKATAKNKADELTNSGYVLIELLGGELLALLCLVDAAKQLHVGGGLLKCNSSVRLRLELLKSDVLVAADDFHTTLPSLGNVTALEVLESDVVSSTHVVWGRFIIVGLGVILLVRLLQLRGVHNGCTSRGLAHGGDQLENCSPSNQGDK